MLQGAMAAADARAQNGDAPEAAILVRSVERVDPDYPGVKELAQRVGQNPENIWNRSWLGINRRIRVETDPGFLYRLLFYLPDRAFDLLDLVSFDVHLGIGAFANVHATRAAQVGAGLRTKIGVGLHNPRSIGLANEAEVGVAALALGSEAFSGASVGIPGGLALASDSMAGMHWPSGTVYRTYRDYWALGASLTAGFVGFEFDFHPIQIFDFIGGIVLIDFARDDFATTRRLSFNGVEIELLRSLNEVQRERVWQGAQADVEP